MSMRAIRSVSGESLQNSSTLTLMNDLSRQCPTHAQLLFTLERDTMCVCGGETAVISAFAPDGVWVCTVVCTPC